MSPHPEGMSERVTPTQLHPLAKRGDGGGGGSRTRVRKRACERLYRFSPACNFAADVKAGPNRPRLVRLISPVAYGPKARGQPTLMTLRPTAVGGQPGERVT